MFLDTDYTDFTDKVLVNTSQKSVLIRVIRAQERKRAETFSINPKLFVYLQVELENIIKTS